MQSIDVSLGTCPYCEQLPAIDPTCAYCRGSGRQTFAPFIHDKRHLYATAFHAELAHFCSLHGYRESDDTYLCNFGYANVRIAAVELSRFCL